MPRHVFGNIGGLRVARCHGLDNPFEISAVAGIAAQELPGPVLVVERIGKIVGGKMLPITGRRHEELLAFDECSIASIGLTIENAAVE